MNTYITSVNLYQLMKMKCKMNITFERYFIKTHYCTKMKITYILTELCSVYNVYPPVEQRAASLYVCCPIYVHSDSVLSQVMGFYSQLFSHTYRLLLLQNSKICRMQDEAGFSSVLTF